MKFPPRPGIMDIEPYIPGLSKAGTAKIIKLSSNENPLGPSPKAVAASIQSAEKIHRYPDAGSVELREALAKKHGIAAGRIVCGTGSDEIISLLCRAYCGEGDEVLYGQYGFLMYPIAAHSAGATPVKSPEAERGIDLVAMLDAVTSKTKIVFLANPNNPTGSTVMRDDLIAFHNKLRPDILLVLDSAYAEYVESSFYTDGIDLVNKYDNVVMLRTFSKLYGLGGMRVGWSYSSLEIADVLNRVRGIFNLGITAQAAALAALDDHDYIEKSLSLNREQRAWISKNLTALGLHVYPSEANFILFSLGSAEKAAACLEFLKGQGILARGMTAYGLADCIRLTIGLPEDMQAVAQSIKNFLKN